MNLTKNELQIMNVFWQADIPLTGADLNKRLVSKTWKDASIHYNLSKLLEKGAIEEHGFEKDGKSIARTFVPAISSMEYYEKFFAQQPQEDFPIILSALLKTSESSFNLKSLMTIIADWANEGE